MSRIIGSPLCWLSILALLTLAARWVTGQLQPSYVPDSETYINFDWTSPWSQIRTVGYPLFLKAAAVVADGQRAVPLAQWLVFVVAVGVFYWGLQRAGYRKRIAAACAATLLLGRGNFETGSMVIAESLAISLTIAAAGFFFAYLSPPKNAAARFDAALLACAVLTFAAYQVRPAFLFLLPLWPLASLWLEAAMARPRPIRARLARCGIVVCAMALPFLAFCSFRAVTVGHWGLSSFGGYNIVGVAGQFLDDEMVAQLPAELRTLAREILTRRQLLTGYMPPESFYAMEEMYNPTIWDMAVPAANGIYGHEPLKTNQMLAQLSQEILRRRTYEYSRWLAWNLNHARVEIIQLTAFDLGTLTLGLVFLIQQLSSLLWGKRPASPKALPRGEQQPSDLSLQDIRHQERHLVFWLAVLIVFAKSALVILVEPANSRYMAPAMVFLPASIAVLVAHYVEQSLAYDFGLRSID